MSVRDAVQFNQRGGRNRPIADQENILDQSFHLGQPAVPGRRANSFSHFPKYLSRTGVLSPPSTTNNFPLVKKIIIIKYVDYFEDIQIFTHL